MMFLPLVGIAPVTYSARVIRALHASLRCSLKAWHARRCERFYFGSLNEYEVERLARDIGISRTELLGDQLRPNRHSLGPPLFAARDRTHAKRGAPLTRPTDA